MTKHVFTHTGWVVTETPPGMPSTFYEVKLRRTKLYWIDEKKIRYLPIDGRPETCTLSSIGKPRLDLKSIKEIVRPRKKQRETSLEKRLSAIEKRLSAIEKRIETLVVIIEILLRRTE